MTPDAFQKTLTDPKPPVSLSDYLKALWYDAKGDWEKAHTLVQDRNDSTAAWIHAYLHRKEGDTGNADYWYRRAGQRRPAVSLEEEWNQLVAVLL